MSMVADMKHALAFYADKGYLGIEQVNSPSEAINIMKSVSIKIRFSHRIDLAIL